MKIIRPDDFSYLNSLFAAKISGAIEEWLHEEASLYLYHSGTALALGPQRIPVSYLLHTLSKERESHTSPSLDTALALLLASVGMELGEVRLFSLVSVAHKLNSPCKGTCLCLRTRAWRGAAIHRGHAVSPLFVRCHLPKLPCLKVQCR